MRGFKLTVLIAGLVHFAPGVNAEYIETRDGLRLKLSSDGRIERITSGSRRYSMNSFNSGLHIRDVHNTKVPVELEAEQVSRNPASYRVTSPNLYLAAALRYTPKTDHIVIDIDVSDTSGKTRALEIVYSIPVGYSGWTWWKDLRVSQTIRQGQSYSVQPVSSPFGLEGKTSLYPFSALCEDDQSGLALAVAPGLFLPAQLRYQNRTLSAQFSVALSSRARQKGKSSFHLILYRFNARHGMAAAASRYLAISARGLPSETKSPLPDPDSFFNISPVADLRYLWIYPDSPAYAVDLLNRLSDPVRQATVQPYLGEKSVVFKVIKTSMVRRANGWPMLTMFQKNSKNNRVVAPRRLEYLLNLNPALLEDRKDENLFAAGHQVLAALQKAFSANPDLKGIRLNDLSGSHQYLDFDPGHFNYASYPLTYDKVRMQPAIRYETSLAELAAAIRAQQSSGDSPLVGKRIWVHQPDLLQRPPSAAGFLADVWSFNAAQELGKDDLTKIARLRSLAPSKPLVSFISSDTAAAILKGPGAAPSLQRLFQWHTCLGIPLLIDKKTTPPDLQKRIAAVQKSGRLAALAHKIQTAGWNPIPQAKVIPEGIWLEQFGSGRGGPFYISLLNTGKKAASASVDIHLGQGGEQWAAEELLSASRLAGSQEGGHLRLKLDMPAREGRILRIK